LPWSPLMKMRPGAISIYSLAIIVVLAILLLQNFRHFTIAHIFPAALLFRASSFSAPRPLLAISSQDE
jgi:ABC-type phosphate transport system auxiliary subunit